MNTIWTPERRELARVEAEKWRGVPHIDRIAHFPFGIDCIHYVKAIFVASHIIEDRGLGTYDTTLGQAHESHDLRDTFLRCLHAKALDGKSQQEFGDIAVFKTGGVSAHCGFIIGNHVYHALAERCVTKSAWNLWRHRCHSLVRVYAEGWRETP